MARAHGVALKALIEIAGTPMIARVVAALRASPSVGRIVIAAQQVEALRAVLPETDRIVLREAEATPARTVGAILAETGAPLLVTTADHPLLTAEMVESFVAGLPAGADAAAGLARAEIIRRELPQTRRTWLRFADGDYSGCNLFLLSTPTASNAVAFWQRLEARRKSPWRMALLAGPVTLLLYASRRATLATILRRLGRRAGARLAAIDLPFARAAVDVDKPADLALVQTLLEPLVEPSLEHA